MRSTATTKMNAMTKSPLPYKFACNAAALLVLMGTAPAQAARPATAPSDPPPPQHQRPNAKGKPCHAESEFLCTSIKVPLDHFGPSDYTDIKIDVTYGVYEALGDKKGTLVVAVGGPGGSGIAEADAQLRDFSSAVRDRFDIVYFDIRGVGRSGQLDCPEAYSHYLSSTAETPAEESEAMNVASAFAANCVAELDLPDAAALRYYTSRQIAADVDAIRRSLGAKKIWLYGQSYGTELAQHYATAYPSRLAGMVLDGVVDVTVPPVQFLHERTQLHNDVLVRTLKACAKDALCSKDAKQDLLVTYDELIKQLKVAPIIYKAPRDDGEVITNTLTRRQVEITIAGLIEYDFGRMQTQRILAAVSQGDYTLLGRYVGYDSAYFRPPARPTSHGGGGVGVGVGGEAKRQSDETPTDSDAMFYIVECGDYQYFAGAARERAKAFMRYGDKVDTLRLARYFYQGLTCAYWPHTGTGYEVVDLTGAGAVPTLIVAASADVLTPLPNAERLLRQVENARMVLHYGGRHVMYMRGDSCVDSAVDAFLLEDALPETGDDKTLHCEGAFLRPYRPIAAADARAYTNPLEALRAFEDEFYLLPEYITWNTNETGHVGCTYGGTITFKVNPNGDEKFEIKHCAFSKGFVVSGEGHYYPEPDRTTLMVTISGLKQGQLSYKHTGRKLLLVGTYGGKAVTLTDEDVRR
jgi:pimeloyl-ACP methyl ester carboxylesterase